MSSMIIPSDVNDVHGVPRSFRMPDAGGHYTNSPNNARYGKLSLVLFLCRLSARWATINPKQKFGIGDMGHEDLKPVHSHKTHHGGLAVDIFVIRKDGAHRSGGGAKSVKNSSAVGWSTYDKDANLRLVQEVNTIREGGFPFEHWYFNDTDIQKKVPHFRTDKQAGIQPEQHYDHMHFRLKGSHPHPPEHVEALLRLVWQCPF